MDFDVAAGEDDVSVSITGCAERRGANGVVKECRIEIQYDYAAGQG